MKLQLEIIGLLFIFLAFLHFTFPRYFGWKNELANLSLINREIMYVHTFFIGLTVFLMGLLCITSGSELLETKLGNRVALGFGIFWSLRLFVQLFVYSTALWKGKCFETLVHFIFSIFWAYVSLVFFLIYWKYFP